MIEGLRALWEKHKAVLLYLIFGGLTTVVDFAVCFLLYRLDLHVYVTPELDIYTHVADLIGWVLAVLFAFATNRVWVFQSAARGFLPVVKELAAFAGGRVGTLLLQEGAMFVFCTWLGFNRYVMRIIVAVAVIILNYFISKLLVFRKK
ncbi:MAG: GtrA family protein [Clostridia bacterium]|nr:GtrA family protein [Clostridia bacterium]